MSVEQLLNTNVNQHIEKKNNLSYLSWAWAWAEALKADPTATYKVEMFADKCYMDINGTSMVWVTTTMFNKSMTCQLPVMDYRNKAILNPDAFAVNTAIMRCLAKSLALHGLGLYIYAGEDLPQSDTLAHTETKKGLIHSPNSGGQDEVTDQDLVELQEIAWVLIDLVKENEKSAQDFYINKNLNNEQKQALWTLIDSKTKAALKRGIKTNDNL